MSVKERIRMCRLIDQMERHIEYSEKLGLENQSTFCGERSLKQISRGQPRNKGHSKQTI